ncbi:nagb/rpia/CoA transferase-like protein [Xylariaceae sp. FL1272]|nr:nagb/rpia/CoA transferase-like protein [Xylariaceae sp. FL1272]
MATDEDAASTTYPHQLPLRSNPEIDAFDRSIVKAYHRLLDDDPDLTMPVAAIEALIEALGASSAKTVFETMNLVETQSMRLRQSATVSNPMAVRHGTDLFTQTLMKALKQGPSGAAGNTGAENNDSEFELIRKHLVSNGRLFAERAKDAREKIALQGRFLLTEHCTVLTHGGSRAVGIFLGRAAEAVANRQAPPFKVIYAISENSREKSTKIVADLRAKGIRVATISEGAVAHIMEQVSFVLVGAQAVTAQGGILSTLGTYQIAKLAKDFGKSGKPFYVAAEQHKIGRTFPTCQSKLSGTAEFKQNILDFHKKIDDTETKDSSSSQAAANPLDFTPPTLITSFICDHGVKTTTGIHHEVIETYFN